MRRPTAPLILLVFVFCFSGMGNLLAQENKLYNAWLEAQSIDGKQVISGWCQNNTVAPEHLHYKVTLINKDSAETKESSTLALPQMPTLLLRTVFVIPDGEFESITLEVFNKKELVASAFLKGTLKPSLPPERTDTLTIPESLISFLTDDIEIEGLVIDETRSKLAHDFYELFYTAWSQTDSIPPGASSIIIREQPARAGLGARISVELNDQEITQLNLHPRAEYLEELAAQLVEALRNYLADPNSTAGEIELEDLQGSGIY